ncbi:MAG TPA: PQQ-dependent sugar dehydrogenase [Polyangiaceae bacterium]|nr:PQQ-dependent sugar dehydrogenase [Polyangiaceae bacterium]
MSQRLLRAACVGSIVSLGFGVVACGGDDDAGSGGQGGGTADGGGSGGTGGGSGGATGGSGGGSAASGGSATGGTGGTAGSSGASGAGGASGSSGAGGAATGGTGGGGTGGGGTGGGGTGGGGTGGGGTGGTGGTGGGSASFNCTGPSGAAGNLKLTQVASGYSTPILVKSPDGESARLFVAQKNGNILLIKNGSKVTTPFLNISGRVSTSENERGLLGLAFHPSFASNGRFYVHYSSNNAATAPIGDTVISEFVAGTAASPNGASDTADPASEKVLLTVGQPYGNHNGGSVEFKPGGGSNLFIALGDGGSGGDPQNNGQKLTTMLGKILRIDVNGTSGSKKYGIPSGNMTGGGALPELWSYGLRNPWRTTFDACNGNMYIGDVGQNQWEEINVEPSNSASGKNYGWRVMEASTCFNPSSGCSQSGKVLPVAEYPHSQGCSVTGGYVYRGSKIPWLRGTYIYADYCSGRFWSFRWNGTTATAKAEITSDINPSTGAKSITSFGQDGSGELYVVSGSTVRRIDPE